MESQIINKRSNLNIFTDIAWRMFDKLDLDMSDYSEMWEVLISKYHLAFSQLVENERERYFKFDSTSDFFYEAINRMDITEKMFKDFCRECIQEIPETRMPDYLPTVEQILSPFITDKKVLPNGAVEISVDFDNKKNEVNNLHPLFNDILKGIKPKL